MFRKTAGIQCVCNALFTICLSQVKVFTWGKHDLDFILAEGGKLYKSLNTIDLLPVDDLLRSVQLSVQ